MDSVTLACTTIWSTSWIVSAVDRLDPRHGISAETVPGKLHRGKSCVTLSAALPTGTTPCLLKRDVTGDESLEAALTVPQSVAETVQVPDRFQTRQILKLSLRNCGDSSRDARRAAH